MSKCEFSVQVLTTGHWPTYRSLSADSVMPDVMGKMCDVSNLYITYIYIYIDDLICVCYDIYDVCMCVLCTKYEHVCLFCMLLFFNHSNSHLYLYLHIYIPMHVSLYLYV
jgi:hypothetical protein